MSNNEADRLADPRDCFESIKRHLTGQTSVLATAVIATCDAGLAALAKQQAFEAAAEPAAVPVDVDADNVHDWELVAMLLAEQEGEDPHHLIWEGSPPEPWGEVWCGYEGRAKAIVTLLAAQNTQKADQSAWHAGLDEGRAQKAEATQAALPGDDDYYSEEADDIAQAEQRAALQELADMHQEMGVYGVAEPMSYDTLVELWHRSHSAHKSEYSIDWYRAGVRDAEAHHGILAEAGIKEKP